MGGDAGLKVLRRLNVLAAGLKVQGRLNVLAAGLEALARLEALLAPSGLIASPTERLARAR